MGPKPAAAAALAPPEDPPGLAASSHGLQVLPCSGLSVVARIDNSGVLVRPMTMAPAWRRLRTTGASSGAMRSLKIGNPLGVGVPETSMLVLIVTGIPCNGPIARPLADAASAASASLRA